MSVTEYVIPLGENARKRHYHETDKGKVIGFAARIGDICKTTGWHSVPLTSFRLNNICTEYVFDMQPIMEVSEPLPYNIKTGVEQTVEWLRFKSRVGESGVGESGSRKVRGQKPEVDWPQTHADLRRRFTLRTPQSKRVSSLRETDFNRG